MSLEQIERDCRILGIAVVTEIKQRCEAIRDLAQIAVEYIVQGWYNEKT